jgi:hypothetical protein
MSANVSDVQWGYQMRLLQKFKVVTWNVFDRRGMATRLQVTIVYLEEMINA